MILSNGIFQKICCLKKLPPESVITGEDFLKEEGFLRILKVLNQDTNRKIVIFGDGTLVFASANLLLNGPLFYDKNEAFKSPFIEKRIKKKCLRCCETCKKRAAEKNLKTLQTEPSEENAKKANYTEKNKRKKVLEEKKEKITECDCSCVCFGDFKAGGFSNWKKSNDILPILKETEVILLVNEKKSDLLTNLKGNALKLFKEVNFFKKSIKLLNLNKDQRKN